MSTRVFNCGVQNWLISLAVVKQLYISLQLNNGLSNFQSKKISDDMMIHMDNGRLLLYNGTISNPLQLFVVKRLIIVILFTLHTTKKISTTVIATQLYAWDLRFAACGVQTGARKGNRALQELWNGQKLEL